MIEGGHCLRIDVLMQGVMPPTLAWCREAVGFKKLTYDEIVARDKANLDIFWLKGETLEDTD